MPLPGSLLVFHVKQVGLFSDPCDPRGSGFAT